MCRDTPNHSIVEQLFSIHVIVYAAGGGPGMSAVTSGAECAREGSDVTGGCARSTSIASPPWRRSVPRRRPLSWFWHWDSPPPVTAAICRLCHQFYSLTLFEDFQILEIVIFWIDCKEVLILREVRVIRQINIWNPSIKISITDRTDIYVYNKSFFYGLVVQIIKYKICIFSTYISWWWGGVVDYLTTLPLATALEKWN